MTLSLADGGRATILSVTREKLASPQDVYNFEVADFHTYFVASAGVWVHNSCRNQVNSGLYEFSSRGKRYVGQSGNINRRLRQHAKKYGDDIYKTVRRHRVSGDRGGRAGKTVREIAEQRLLDRRTRQFGRNAMYNKVNPIGRNRIHLMGRGYVRR